MKATTQKVGGAGESPPRRLKIEGSFTCLPDWYLEDYAAVVGGSAHAVYTMLLKHANNETAQCWPSRSRLAALTGLSTVTVWKAINTLRDAGLILIERRRGDNGRDMSNLYTMLDPREEATGDHAVNRGGSEFEYPPIKQMNTNYTNYELEPSEPEPDDNSAGAELSPHAAAQPPPLAASFRDLSDRLRSERNKPAILLEIYKLCYGDGDSPSYGYLGSTAKAVGGAGRLAELMWQNTTRPPTGDVLAYIRGAVKGRESRDNGRRAGGRGRGSGPESREKGDDDAEAERIRKLWSRRNMLLGGRKFKLNTPEQDAELRELDKLLFDESGQVKLEYRERGG